MSESICHNCGLPKGSISNLGRSISVKGDAKFGDKNTRSRQVWCCCDECAVQALGISAYGLATFRWPITLAQFRATNPLADGRKKRAPNKAYLGRLATEKSLELAY
jgi:hypothetical protein